MKKLPVLTRAEKRERKRRLKMKISGAAVKGLQRMLIARGRQHRRRATY